MSYDLDDLLNEVDKWKLKLYKKLNSMTPKQQAVFWERSLEKACKKGYIRPENIVRLNEGGLKVLEPAKKTKRTRKKP